MWQDHVKKDDLIEGLSGILPDSQDARSMELLYIDKLPKGFGRNKLMRLLIEEGNFDKLRIGKIDVTGKRAIIELDSDRASRVAEALEQLRLIRSHGGSDTWAEASLRKAIAAGRTYNY